MFERYFFSWCGRERKSHLNSSVAIIAPASWATINKGALLGLMPEKVSVNALAIVTAGLANDVEAVNQ